MRQRLADRHAGATENALILSDELARLRKEVNDLSGVRKELEDLKKQVAAALSAAAKSR